MAKASVKRRVRPRLGDVTEILTTKGLECRAAV